MRWWLTRFPRLVASTVLWGIGAGFLLASRWADRDLYRENSQWLFDPDGVEREKDRRHFADPWGDDDRK